MNYAILKATQPQHRPQPRPRTPGSYKEEEEDYKADADGIAAPPPAADNDVDEFRPGCVSLDGQCVNSRFAPSARAMLLTVLTQSPRRAFLM